MSHRSRQGPLLLAAASSGELDPGVWESSLPHDVLRTSGQLARSLHQAVEFRSRQLPLAVVEVDRPANARTARPSSRGPPLRPRDVHGEIDAHGALERENRLRAGEYASGRCLDCFSYAGAFAWQLARRAERVTAVEMQATAAALARENAALNRAENVEVVEANAFDYLRDAALRGARSSARSASARSHTGTRTPWPRGPRSGTCRRPASGP